MQRRQNTPFDELQMINENPTFVQLAVITGTILRILGVYVVEGREITAFHTLTSCLAQVTCISSSSLARGCGKVVSRASC
jgi:hypothetical protein